MEVDETYIGRLEGVPKKAGGPWHKNTVLTLVQRNGSARSFHVEGHRRHDVEGIMYANIKLDTALMTDEGNQYTAQEEWLELKNSLPKRVPGLPQRQQDAAGAALRKL